MTIDRTENAERRTANGVEREVDRKRIDPSVVFKRLFRGLWLLSAQDATT
jgi:hypothetical protein